MKIIKFIKDNSYLYKTMSRIITLYINKGDYDKDFNIGLFRKRIFPKLFESIIIGLIFTLFSYLFDSKVDAEKIISLGISFYASILGFGMAAYTILLMLADEILIFLNEKKNNTPQIFNSDLAFPLIMIGFIVFLFFIILSIGNNLFTLFLTSSLFIYGLLLIFEILRIIYLSMGFVIKNKLEKKDNNIG